jgi:hypothetical protein
MTVRFVVFEYLCLGIYQLNLPSWNQLRLLKRQMPKVRVRLYGRSNLSFKS